jgi:hypothetical protein
MVETFVFDGETFASVRWSRTPQNGLHQCHFCTYGKVRPILRLYWLVVSTPLNNIRQLGVFQYVEKVTFMFQTTKQYMEKHHV